MFWGYVGVPLFWETNRKGIHRKGIRRDTYLHVWLRVERGDIKEFYSEMNWVFGCTWSNPGAHKKEL